MTLAQHLRAFEVDGSLRDIYVLDTTLEHWDLMLKYVRTAGLIAAFTCGLEPTTPPATAAEIFAQLEDPEHASFLLSLDVAGVQLNCHFFQTDEIEFDLDPREVTDERRYDALLAFMVGIGQATGNRVVLSGESSSGTRGGFSPIFDLLPGDAQPNFTADPWFAAQSRP